MQFLNLIRWPNLLIILLVQCLVKYALLVPSEADITLNWFGFSLIIISTICIAAAGYVINDIYDIETDSINKPNKVIVGKMLGIKRANYIFIILNIIGVLLGFYLAHLVGRSNLFGLFVVISILLYVYASYLKQTILLGNIVVSVLVSFSLIIVGIFELLPIIDSQNQDIQLFWFKIILVYALFAFFINMLREMVKDIQDIEGDHKVGMNTLPIIVGRNRSRNIIFVLSFIPSLLIVYFLYTYLFSYVEVVIYFLLLTIAPLIITSIKLFNAKSKKDFKIISNLLKSVMLTGMLSMILYPLIIQ